MTDFLLGALLIATTKLLGISLLRLLGASDREIVKASQISGSALVLLLTIAHLYLRLQ